MTCTICVNGECETFDYDSWTNIDKYVFDQYVQKQKISKNDMFLLLKDDNVLRCQFGDRVYGNLIVIRNTTFIGE